MNEQPVVLTDDKCLICKEALYSKWSDTHGIGCCVKCGMPYKFYHYDEHNNRIQKPIESALKQSGIMLAQRYWDEKQHRVFPACFDLGMPRYGTTSYSGATEKDIVLWNKWYVRQSENRKVE